MNILPDWNLELLPSSSSNEESATSLPAWDLEVQRLAMSPVSSIDAARDYGSSVMALEEGDTNIGGSAIVAVEESSYETDSKEIAATEAKLSDISSSSSSQDKKEEESFKSADKDDQDDDDGSAEKRNIHRKSRRLTVKTQEDYDSRSEHASQYSHHSQHSDYCPVQPVVQNERRDSPFKGGNSSHSETKTPEPSCCFCCMCEQRCWSVWIVSLTLLLMSLVGAYAALVIMDQKQLVTDAPSILDTYNNKNQSLHHYKLARKAEILDELVRSMSMEDNTQFYRDVLSNYSTPQSQALEWLLTDDVLQLTARPGNNSTAIRLKQRYALAVLYISTQRLEWLSPTHECSWHGVTCTVAETDADPLDVLELVTSFHSDYKLNETKRRNIPRRLSQPPDVLSLYNSVQEAFVLESADVVTALRLANLSLTGPLPLELTLLEHLQHLDLSFNNFSYVSPDLKLSTHLETLQLNDNPRLTGSLSLTSTDNLTEVDIHDTLLFLNASCDDALWHDYCLNTTAHPYTLFGRSDGDSLGSYVSLSYNGSRALLTRSNPPRARLLEFDGDYWSRIGNDIPIVNHSLVQLSLDGSTIVAAMYISNTTTTIKSYRLTDSQWKPTSAVRVSGMARSIALDGQQLAVLVQTPDNFLVKFFEYQLQSTWTKTRELLVDNSTIAIDLSRDLLALASSDVALYSLLNDTEKNNLDFVQSPNPAKAVSLAKNGTRLAVLFSDYVQIYQASNYSSWSPLGSVIKANSMQLSNDGEWLFVGFTTDNLAGSTALHRWNGNDWAFVDSPFEGEMDGDQLGYSVTISATSNQLVLAAGAPGNDLDARGYVKIVHRDLHYKMHE